MDPIPAIASADPLVRYTVQVQVPAGLFLERSGDHLIVRIPGDSTNLTVGTNMATGTEVEMQIIQNDIPIANAGVRSLSSSLDFKPGARIFTKVKDGIPQANANYSVQYRLTYFETDIPAQHFWSPRSGKKYKVLWTKTFL